MALNCFLTLPKDAGRRGASRIIPQISNCFILRRVIAILLKPVLLDRQVKKLVDF